MHLDRRLFDGKVISSVVYPEFFPLCPTDHVVNLGCGLGPQAMVYKGNFARMVGVDLHEERLAASRVLLAEHHVQHYETICAPVEATGLPDTSFDKAIAIDIIEHLEHPRPLLMEAYRLLRPGGEMLVSVPAMHDCYTHGVKWLARMLGKKTQELPHGHPDAHNTSLSVRGWMNLVRSTPFQIVRTRATTLWPPLHLYGLSRFWFTNPVIHALDRMLCHFPGLKHLGQAYLMVLCKRH